jgi:hypothetical protein
MSEQPRNWDREMADIDKMIAKQGSVPPGTPAAPTPVGMRAPAEVAPRPPRRSVALTWFWVVLALALGAALLLWPYQRACGLQLAFFLGAAAVTTVIALLAALSSWANRRGFAHVLALLVIVWAGAVAAREVLPRVGYARTSLAWMCAAAPVPAGPQPGSPAPSAAGQ